MPNSIKYNTSTETEALNSGDFWVGVGDVGKGPTSTTGYHNGINPPSGGYTIYVHKASGGPSIHLASDDAELISITNKIADTSYTTINECFNYFNGQSDKMVTHQTLNFRVTDGLVLDFDADAIPSYPQNGTTWNDLSGDDNNGTLYNGPTFDSKGWMEFDGTDDYISVPNDETMDAWDDEQTIIVWEYHDFTSGRRNIWNQAYGGFGTWTHEQGGSVNYYFGNSGANAQPYTSANSGTTVRGQWNMLCVTRDITTVNWYQNGVLTSTRGNPYGSLTNTTAGVAIGTGYTGVRWEGKMSKILAYTKALTQSEVLQNYYQAPIVTDGLSFAVDAGNLVSYESGDTTTNSLIGSVTGTLNNGVAFNSSNGGYWEFDGTNDEITLSANISLGNGNIAWTVSAWVKSTTTVNSLGQGSVASNDGSGPVYSMMGINSGKIVYWTYQSNAWAQKLGVATVNDGGWHLLTWVNYSNTTMDMYVDGVFDKNVPNSTSGNNNPIDTIGNSWAASFDGEIAALHIYQSKSLTAGEVQQNYNATKSKFL